MKKQSLNLIRKVLSLVLLLSVTSVVNARDIYGYMTGNANPTDIPVGMYKFDSETLERTPITGLMATFWGGAFAEDNYYFLFSSDYQGYIAEGLHTFNFENGSMMQVAPYVPYQCSDMTYDCSTGTMYGVQIQNGGEPVSHRLIKIDLTYGEIEKVAELSVKIAAIACNYWGDMYAMGCDGNLYLMDKATGELTLIASTGFATNNVEPQSMDFDRETGELYWSFLDTNEDAHFTILDVYADDVVKNDRIMPDNALIVGLYSAAPKTVGSAPAAPLSMSVSGNEGSVLVSWTNPSETFDGAALTSISKVEVYRNNQLVYTSDNAQPGAEMTFTDNAEGIKSVAATRYVVYAYNESGRGEGSSDNIFLGSDIPGVVTALGVRAEGNAAVLTWTAPETGKRGGSINPDELFYKVTRMPDNKVFDDIKECTFTDNTVTTTAHYSYKVVCGNELGMGNEVVSETLVVGSPINAPYDTDFSSELLAAQWEVVNTNGDNVTWKWQNNSFVYPFSFSNAADDHLVSVPFQLHKGMQYKVRYTISAPNLFSSPEHFRLSLGDRVLEDLAEFNNDAPEERTVEFTVDEDGIYSFTLSSLSPMNNWQIAISHFAVDVVVDVDMALTKLSGDADLVAGTPVVYNATLVNKGTKDITSAEVKLTDSEGNLLSTAALDKTVAVGETYQLPIEWTPAQNISSVTATVYADGDNTKSNDAVSKNVFVIADDEFFVETESDGSHPNLLPFAFQGYAYTYAQAIYRPEDLNISNGIISGMYYRYTNSGNTVTDRHIQVYMADSDTGDILDGWKNEEDMTLVFDGYVNFENGSNMLRLTFDAPFTFNGKNLRIMTVKLDDTTFSDIRFNAKNHGSDVRTAIYYGDKHEVDKNSVQGSSMLSEVMLRVKNVETGIEGSSADDMAVSFRDGLLLIGGTADSIEVYSLAGVLVDRSISTDRLNVSSLADGAYIVKIKSNGVSTVRKIVVKH